MREGKRYGTSAQQRLEWEERGAEGKVWCEVEGRVEGEGLEGVIAGIEGRYEVLRTRVVKAEGHKWPVQEIAEAGEEGSGVVEVEEGSGWWRVWVPALNADETSAVVIAGEIWKRSDREVGIKGGEGIQYADYAEWVNEALEQRGAVGRAESRIGGSILRRRGGKKSEGSVSWRLRGEEVSRLRELAERCGGTERSYMASGLGWVWRQLGGSEEMVVRGSGRHYGELSGAVGRLECWLRVERQGEREWREEAVEIERQLVAAEGEQEQAADRSAGEALRFEWRRLPEVGGMRVRGLGETPQRGITVQVLAQGEERIATIRFDGSQYGAGEVERLLRHWRNELLGDWQAGGVKQAAREEVAKDVWEEFARQAEQHPERIAVRNGERMVTYGEELLGARAIARELKRIGVSREVRVGVYLERLPEGITALLGVLAAGACYVPIEPEWPAERVRRQAGDVGLGAVITSKELSARWPVEGLPRVYVELAGEPQQEGAGEEAAVYEGQLAYVLYTSGSTGEPKGVGVSRRALACYTKNLLQELKPEPGEVFVMASGIAADLGYTAIWGALASGGTLRVLSAEEGMDGEMAAGAMDGAGYLKITPSHLEGLLNGSRDEKRLVPMRGLILGGEESSWELVERVKKLRRETRIFNHYGPTETTVGVLMGEVGRELESCAEGLPLKPSLGWPLGHVRAQVLGSEEEPVLDGAEGELWIAGESLARGYWGDARLTADRFRPEAGPGARPGARRYRCGDRVRQLADGRYQFFGRLDDQLKLRGFRVEPAEIEAALQRHPAISLAAVALQDDRLTGWIVPRAGNAGVVQRYLEMRDEVEGSRGAFFNLPNGMSIVHQNASMTQFLYSEIFEQECYVDDLCLRDGAVVIDVGANIGMFTLFAGIRYPGVRIYSIEPIPANCEVLAWNARLYGIDAVIDSCGLARESGAAVFTYYPDFSGASGRYAEPERDRLGMKALALGQFREAGNSGIEDDAFLEQALGGRWKSEPILCTLKSLSGFFAEHRMDHVDLLKIDAEWSELEILAGIREEDWQKIDRIVIEVHSKDLCERVSVVLAGQGFQVTVAQTKSYGGTETANVHARRPGCSRGEKAKPHEPSWFSPQRLLTDVREYAASVLPHHMVPAALKVVSQLPLTLSGKLYRKALPGMEGVSDAIQLCRAEPRDAVEEVVASAWCQTLHLNHLGIYDNFFSLGGHSLLAIQCVSQLRSIFQVELPLRAFFDAPTVSGQAAVLRSLETQLGQMERIAQLMLEIEAMPIDHVEAELKGLQVPLR